MCGGTEGIENQPVTDYGLSPRVRGNRQTAPHSARSQRSIPACAGEPPSRPTAQPFRQEDAAAAEERRAHLRRPRLPGRAFGAGPPAGVGHRPARPAQKGVPLLQARRRHARRQPRRLRRPHQGRHALALLSGVGAKGRAALNHVGAPCSLSSLLLIPQAHRRPRRPGPPFWSYSTTTSPPPTSCAWRGRR